MVIGLAICFLILLAILCQVGERTLPGIINKAASNVFSALFVGIAGGLLIFPVTSKLEPQSTPSKDVSSITSTPSEDASSISSASNVVTLDETETPKSPTINSNQDQSTEEAENTIEKNEEDNQTNISEDNRITCSAADQKVTKDGSLSYEDQEIVYSFVPPVSGKYRIDFDISDVNCLYLFRIYDEKKDQLARAYSDSEGVTVDLENTQEYSLVVKQYRDLPSYTLTIHIPNDIQTVTGEQINGALRFTAQIDSYYYTAPVTGKYRFDYDFGDMQGDYVFRIYSSKNESIVHGRLCNEGDNAELEAGQTYLITIEQYSKFADYLVNIGVPNEESVINGDYFTGEIRYYNQENIYYYYAPITGQYTFALDINDVNSAYNFKIYSEKNELISSQHSYSDISKVYLNEGECYKIVVSQETGTMTYGISISYECE